MTLSVQQQGFLRMDVLYKVLLLSRLTYIMNLFLYFAYDPGNVEKQKFLDKSKPY